MRDVVFKNLTSSDKKRKILASSEISEQEGIRSIITRHFVYIVKEVKNKAATKPTPSLYVLKEHNTQEQKEKFFCKVKGSVLAVCQDRLFLIVFMHSLKINLIALPLETR